MDGLPDLRLHQRLVDGLYTDAMLLADEARGYFDEAGREERESLDPFTRVALSCESIKVTTRLMHVIAWLVTQRAVEAGELSSSAAAEPSRRLGGTSDPKALESRSLPPRAANLVTASVALHRRAAALDRTLASETEQDSVVRAMQQRLAASF